jgi:predicted acyltransferase
MMADSELYERTSQRVKSIDALRGFDMFWIIGGGSMVRSFAEVYPCSILKLLSSQCEHVRWEGFHFEDLIFPLFLFIVGVVLPYSIHTRIQRGATRKQLYYHIFIRTAILLVMGLVFNGLLNFNFAKMRYAGVLQRIAICYFFASLLTMHCKVRGLVITLVSILVLYWAALMLVPVPGFGAGVITPEGCLSSYIDQKFLIGSLYYGYGDNEGILSTLPAVCSCLLGVLAGYWLRSGKSPERKAGGLLGAGLLCLLLGFLWGQQFPIIKVIWTSSFVLFAGGWSFLLLAMFYYVIDVRRCWKWSFFFIVIGSNAIAIYFLQRVVDFGDIAEFFFGGLAFASGSWEAVVLVLGVIIIKWLLLWFLYRRRIFLKV